MAQLPHQHAQAPPVRHRVVQRQRRRVLAGPQAQQPRPQQRPAAQVERLVGHLHDQAARGLAPDPLRLAAQVDDRQREAESRGDVLPGLPAFGEREGRAQRLVAADDAVEGALKRRDIEVAFQPNRQRNVISRSAGRELFQKPEPLLREREWQRCLDAPSRNRARTGNSYPPFLEQERDQPLPLGGSRRR